MQLGQPWFLDIIKKYVPARISLHFIFQDIPDVIYGPVWFFITKSFDEQTMGCALVFHFHDKIYIHLQDMGDLFPISYHGRFIAKFHSQFFEKIFVKISNRPFKA